MENVENGCEPVAVARGAALESWSAPCGCRISDLEEREARVAKREREQAERDFMQHERDRSLHQREYNMSLERKQLSEAQAEFYEAERKWHDAAEAWEVRNGVREPSSTAFRRPSPETRTTGGN